MRNRQIIFLVTVVVAISLGLTACASDSNDAPPLAATPTAVVEAETLDDEETSELPHFSFFVTSLESFQELSGNEFGFGGDLRFGETGPGAGLRGADKICATIAEMSMPGSSVKEWRAFPSVSADEIGPLDSVINTAMMSYDSEFAA